MSYMIQARLSNAQYREGGSNEILFPLSRDDYPGEIQRLGELQAGDAVRQDCMVEEIDSSYEVLQCLRWQAVNVDELDYLARRLESFDEYEVKQFQAACSAFLCLSMKDLINMTFCCQGTTVISDLSKLYLRGQGVTQDVEKAHQLYKASASQGVPYAAFELGKLYRDGLGCEQSSEEAERWFQSAYGGFKSLKEQSHDDKLQYRLGWMRLHGVGTERDEQEAREWFKRSAKLGNPHAQYQLAKLILVDDSSTTEQIRTAVEWLTRAADAGQDCAQYALGKLYRDGIGVEKDTFRAVVWFVQAAEQNNSYAAYALGKLYLEGEETRKDMEKALRWLRRSAEQGNQFAQYRLGRLLLTAEDVPKDVDEAIRLLTASAEQGNQYAQYQLGKLYLLGHEVERDEEAAVQWFKLSADQGNEYAQWFLDHLHEFGGPTPAQCVIRLLHHMSRIFQEQSQRQAGMRMEVDRKLRQKIREKKIAMGHKADDHEEQVLGYSPR